MSTNSDATWAHRGAVGSPGFSRLIRCGKATTPSKSTQWPVSGPFPGHWWPRTRRKMRGVGTCGSCCPSLPTGRWATSSPAGLPRKRRCCVPWTRRMIGRRVDGNIGSVPSKWDFYFSLLVLDNFSFPFIIMRSLVDWKIDRLVDWLFDWSIVRLIVWLVDCLYDWLIDWLRFDW